MPRVKNRPKWVKRENLLAVPTPKPVGNWTPVPYFQLLQCVEQGLAYQELDPVETLYMLSHRGSRATVVFHLPTAAANGHANLGLVLRMSLDQSCSAGIAWGLYLPAVDSYFFFRETLHQRKAVGVWFGDFSAMITGCLSQYNLVSAVTHGLQSEFANTPVSADGSLILVGHGVESNVWSPTVAFKLREEFCQPSFPCDPKNSLWVFFQAMSSVLWDTPAYNVTKHLEQCGHWLRREHTVSSLRFREIFQKIG